MPRNQNGDYVLPNPPVVSGALIEAAWANTTLADIAAALTDSLSRSGAGSASAPILFADGAQAAPGIAFTNEAGTGFYRPATGDLYLAILGQNLMRFTDENGVQLYANSAWHDVWYGDQALLAADIAQLQNETQERVTGQTWNGSLLVTQRPAGNLSTPIKLINAIKAGGIIRHASRDFTSSPTVLADATSYCRFTLTCNQNMTLTIQKPSGPDAELGDQYCIEGSIIVTNGNTPGNITLAGVSANNILGVQNVNPNEVYVLSYLIHRLPDGTYREVYSWAT